MYTLPKVTIGIVTHNRTEELILTLSKIVESDYPDPEVVVVDNASEDNSYQRVTDQFPAVQIRRLEKNIGAAANNLIFSQARGRYIILYNDDSMPATPAAIREIVDFLELHPDIAALCTNVINYRSKKSETPGGEKYSLARYDDYCETLILHGAGSAFRAESIRQTTGFPEEFFLCGEESDLVLQMVRKNLRIAYKKDIITYHRTSPTNRYKPWRLFMFTRNGIWLFWKYFPFILACWLSVAYAFGQLAVALSRARPVYLLFWVKGVFQGIKGIPVQRAKKLQLDGEAIKKTGKWRQQVIALNSIQWLKGHLYFQRG